MQKNKIKIRLQGYRVSYFLIFSNCFCFEAKLSTQTSTSPGPLSVAPVSNLPWFSFRSALFSMHLTVLDT